MSEEQQASFNGWAKVEVMGHQSHIGYVRTEAYGQAVLFRIDTPELPEREFILEQPEYVNVSANGRQWMSAGAKVKRVARQAHSVLVGAGSVYRIVPLTETAAIKAIDASCRPELILIEAPPERALQAATGVDDDESGGYDPDEEYPGF